jgi:hypothetical protein
MNYNYGFHCTTHSKGPLFESVVYDDQSWVPHMHDLWSANNSVKLQAGLCANSSLYWLFDQVLRVFLRIDSTLLQYFTVDTLPLHIIMPLFMQLTQQSSEPEL